MSGVTKEEAEAALKLLDLTRDGLADIMRCYRAEVVAADEWRPLADYVAGLVALALKKERGEVEYPESVPPDVMIRLKGKPFRCDCGCNCFRHPEGQPNKYRCNGCRTVYEGE